MGEAILFGRGKLVLYDPVFANNSWEDIIAYCQRGTVPEEWKVGDQKAMTINGTDYLIDIIGKDHDDYADGSGIAPLTFQMHNCYGTAYAISQSNNSEGWANCYIRTSVLPNIYLQMPSEIQSAICEVNKLTSAGNKSTAIITTADKLFLLSEIEVFGSVNYSVSGEGHQYAYYSAGNSKIKYLSGSAQRWHERSPYHGDTSSYCYVNTSGVSSARSGSSGTSGVAFAFCF